MTMKSPIETVSASLENTFIVPIPSGITEDDCMVNVKKILISYASAIGSTEKLAQVIAEGARKVDGVSVVVMRARDVKPDDAVSANGYAFGSNSASEFMEGELKILLEKLYPVKDKLRGKPVLLFTTGQGGQVVALESLERVMGVFNLQWIKPGIAIKGMPGEADKAKAIEMGEKLSEEVKKLKSDNKPKSEYIVA